MVEQAIRNRQVRSSTLLVSSTRARFERRQPRDEWIGVLPLPAMELLVSVASGLAFVAVVAYTLKLCIFRVAALRAGFDWVRATQGSEVLPVACGAPTEFARCVVRFGPRFRSLRPALTSPAGPWPSTGL